MQFGTSAILQLQLPRHATSEIQLLKCRSGNSFEAPPQNPKKVRRWQHAAAYFFVGFHCYQQHHHENKALAGHFFRRRKEGKQKIYGSRKFMRCWVIEIYEVLDYRKMCIINETRSFSSTTFFGIFHEYYLSSLIREESPTTINLYNLPGFCSQNPGR